MIERNVIRTRCLWALTFWMLLAPIMAGGQIDAERFKNPPADVRPETWFHLIGGNVSKPGLTVDLEAIAAAGLSGIQGRPWAGVSPQIACLSLSWDDRIAHVGRETRRLGLNFTMQNCPGWAMSGGPRSDNVVSRGALGRTDCRRCHWYWLLPTM